MAWAGIQGMAGLAFAHEGLSQGWDVQDFDVGVKYAYKYPKNKLRTNQKTSLYHL